ncbi:MAG: hypothetical protein WDN00_12200 [Limisphaerales bacterium]
MRVGDEDNAIHATQNELAGRVVNHLARHRVQLELRLEALDRHRLDRQKVEKQRAVGTRRERDELALVARVCLHVVVDLYEVGRLAAHRGAVIDDLDL